MEDTNTAELMNQLISGLQGLQTDYEKLFGQYETLQKKLNAAREQYNELAKLHGKSAVDTPPLSLISTHPLAEDERPLAVSDILESRNEHETARNVRAAILATQLLQKNKHNGDVKIWSGPSADVSTTSQKLPSITESPMEQDFTIVGTPSKLGCPFASMSGKKLSSHAASVLNRYHGASSRDGQGRETSSIASGSGSRLHGRTSSKSRRRSSLLDPIKAEICGIDDHNDVEATPQKLEENVQAEPGVCPIRFINQHSPEELATYFEKHKHELPRSHEVCVKRYQGDEQQVRELDARYGNIAQMIRGLGEKHQNFLPAEPEDAEDYGRAEIEHEDAVVNGERVTNWANTVSAEPKNTSHDDALLDGGRESHFARPLRDIRLGESPTRPWGIPVPVQDEDEIKSEASSAPVQINTNHVPVVSSSKNPAKVSKCPFAAHAVQADADYHESPHPPVESVAEKISAAPEVGEPAEKATTTIFSGPLVIGYGPEDAALFLSRLEALKQSS